MYIYSFENPGIIPNISSIDNTKLNLYDKTVCARNGFALQFSLLSVTWITNSTEISFRQNYGEPYEVELIPNGIESGLIVNISAVISYELDGEEN